MGNSAGKHKGEAFRAAVDHLIESPLTDSTEEQEEILEDIFSCDLDEHGFYEWMTPRDAMEMAIEQPENVKILARKALSNMSCFMESNRPGPSEEELLTSIRILTRLMPAILSDPVLCVWAWRRKSLPYFLLYLEPQDASFRDDAEAVAEEDQDLQASSSTSPSSGPHHANEEAEASMEQEEGGPYGIAQAGRKNAWGNEFLVCFASVALHAIMNLLSFPGFAVDEEAADWDDSYTPIPAVNYGIKESAVIWSPGIAVTELNMREVTHLDANRVELLRLMTTALSLPLFLDTPTPDEWDTGGALQSNAETTPQDRIASLFNPLAALITSRHLPFAPELFYSLLNVVIASPESVRATGTKGGAWRHFGLGGTATPGRAQSLQEWCFQSLALLLRHGRPYKDLLRERGITVEDNGGEVLAHGVSGIDDRVLFSAEFDVDYNCYRRNVFAIYSDEDLGKVAMALLVHLYNSSLGIGRDVGDLLSAHHDALMVFASFVRENPCFVSRLAASADLARGAAICMCHYLEDAVVCIDVGDRQRDEAIEDDDNERENPVGDSSEDGWSVSKRGRRRRRSRRDRQDEGIDAQQPLGEDVGVLVLTSQILLILSQNKDFLAALAEVPAGERKGKFVAPQMEIEPGMTLLESVVGLSAWTLSRQSGAIGVASPALAAVARNASVFLLGGMRRATGEWLLDALEKSLSPAPDAVLDEGFGSDQGQAQELDAEAHEAMTVFGQGSNGKGVASVGVARLLLECLAAAVAFHHEDQVELLLSLTKRSLTPMEKSSISSASGYDNSYEDVGVMQWLAARAGLLDDEPVNDPTQSEERGNEASKDAEVLVEHEAWFKIYMVGEPWEGWPMRQVLWPIIRRLLSVELAYHQHRQGSSPSRAGSGDEDGNDSDRSERQIFVDSETIAIVARAQEYILRPLGLCSPWKSSEGSDNSGDRASSPGSSSVPRPTEIELPSTAHATQSAASKGQADPREDKQELPEGYAIGDEKTTKDGSAADEHVVEAGMRAATAEATHTPGEDKSTENARGTLQEEADGKDVRASFETTNERLARVTVVEEPWQSIYLWSLLFMKTSIDIPLFHPGSIKLFEIVENHDSDQKSDLSPGDGERWTSNDQGADGNNFYDVEANEGDNSSLSSSDSSEAAEEFMFSQEGNVGSGRIAVEDNAKGGGGASPNDVRHDGFAREEGFV